MDDILHILEMLRQRAEANLAVLMRQREKYLSDISYIKAMIKGAQTPLPIVEDLSILECWRESQASKLVQIRKKLAEIEEDIGKTKLYYKTILAKNLAANGIAENLQTAKSLKAEDEEADSLLEVSLLKRIAKKKSL